MAGAAADVPLRRELLDRVLQAVRSIGAAGSIDEILQRIADDVVEVLGFRASALNVRAADDRLYVRAVCGPDGAKNLLHASASLDEWIEMLKIATRHGELYFVGHEQADNPVYRAIDGWSEEHVPDLPPDSWHPGDALLAPLYRPDGVLLGVLSVDLALGEAHEPQKRTALDLFAQQAARTLTDADERNRLDNLRRDAERRWGLAWESGLVAGGVLDADGRILDVNAAAAHALGWERREMVGRHFLAMVSEQNAQAAADRFLRLKNQVGSSQVSERVLRHRDGHDVWCLMHAAAVTEGAPRRTVLLMQWTDITERKLAEARMVHELHHDPLTDLPNRRAAEEMLADLFERGIPYGAMYCDIDGFKGISDGLGHEAGDELLRSIAARLRGSLDEGSTLARLGSDEFFVCQPGSGDVTVATQTAARLVDGLTEAFGVDGERHTVRMSVGVSTSRPMHHHPLEVMREADQALLRAKRRGRSRIEVFDPGQDQAASSGDLELERALRQALDDSVGLEPYYQSIISLSSGSTVGYEALLRWRHPQHGVLLPDRFLPIAERAGLNAPVGWRMIDLVAASLPHDVAGTVGRPWVSVNVSAAQLGRGQLPGVLRRVIDASFGGDANALHVEITETSLLDASPATVDELYAVADLGVVIALDDFGTGYSSLTLLRDLPVSAIKIDRSFIAPIAVDVRARTIVQHTIELCQGLGMTTIAEGIETHEQLAWLQTLGCEYGQGYLIDRPSPWPFVSPRRIEPEPPRRFNG